MLESVNTSTNINSPSSFCFYKLLDILPDHACLKVYGVSGLFETKGCLTGRVRDDGHGEPLPLDLVDCEADPININFIPFHKNLLFTEAFLNMITYRRPSSSLPGNS